MLLQAAWNIDEWSAPSTAQNAGGGVAATATPLGMGLLGFRIDRAQQPNSILRGGMSGYLLPFEIISIHLVVVLVGAAYLARAKRRVTGRGGRGEERGNQGL